ncbi:DNA gyrase inhibitor YacG [Shewanella algae]|uniref:DNA gyrase inhibitor YacG n=1 Tax=Shewanella algae TaxID=38313 RepID=UPI00046860D7|nr:DNA gyrase inhibitor YacG [Shewanella algae]MBO2550788.1 DNA gyrase inhibitor YacG [Shewanella algae]MBO2559432.1 DNA gyrase inhibitor YacG [Shewanella algae]MBO2631298.1 DNA gyrase inhibitor YacG [Shewanella algae]MBO2652272.1 DNA gyrase inhibitor YacG [Shewanella algae]MBO2686264.1 DNA gyrase inhibitor YacG [Shewanella algae]
MPITVKCPTCQKEVEWAPKSKFKPFCSERCKLIDLGDWASEKHAIPVKPEFDEQLLDELGYDEGNFFKDQ